VDVDYYENEVIVGSVGVPNFDMRPIDPQVSDIIEPVQPRAPERSKLMKVKTTSRNFYSCMDDETVTDWEFMPKKFKQKYDM
jgi:hypothetical protein